MKLFIAILLFSAPLFVVVWFGLREWLVVRRIKLENQRRLREFEELKRQALLK